MPLRPIRFKPQEWTLLVAPLLIVGAVALVTLGRAEMKRWGQSTMPTPIVARGINELVFSADGRKLASAAQDGSLKVWTVSDGTLRHTVLKSGNGIRTMAFSPDGQVLASTDGINVQFWSQPSQRLLRTLTAQPILAQSPQNLDVNFGPMAFSPDGRWLAIGYEDNPLSTGYGAISLWQAKTGQLHCLLKSNVAALGTMQFSPDNRSLAVWCVVDRGIGKAMDDVVQLWNLQTGTMQWEVKCDELPGALAFSHDGKLLAVSGKRPLLLNAQTGKSAAPLTPWLPQTKYVAFSSDDQILTAFREDGSRLLWDTRSGKVLGQVEANTHAPNHIIGPTATKLSPDAKRLAIGHKQGIIGIWDTEQTFSKARQAQTAKTRPQLKLKIDTVTEQVTLPPFPTPSPR